MQIADIVLGVELSGRRPTRHRSLDWLNRRCSAGSRACRGFAAAGFTDVRITHRFDCFEATSKEKTARRYGVIGVNLSATRSR